MPNSSSNILKTETTEGQSISAFSLAEVSDEHHVGPSQQREKKTRQKISAIEREAYRRGFKKGEIEGQAQGLALGKTEGRRAANEHMAPTVKMVITLLDTLELIHQKTLEECQDDVLSLALFIAAQILSRESKTDQNLLRDLIRRSIQKIGETEKILIRLHPEDRECIYDDIQSLRAALDAKTTIRLQTETSFSRGDCIVEGEELMVDARRTTLLGLFEKALRASE